MLYGNRAEWYDRKEYCVLNLGRIVRQKEAFDEVLEVCPQDLIDELQVKLLFKCETRRKCSLPRTILPKSSPFDNETVAI